jgi:hypothetical protein
MLRIWNRQGMLNMGIQELSRLMAAFFSDKVGKSTFLAKARVHD